MKRSCEYLLIVILITMLAGCSTIPVSQPDLLQARNAYAAAKAKPWVSQYAQVELYDAELALQRAEQAENIEDLHYLSYLAERKAQIAVAVADRKLSSATIAELGKEKNQMLLEARDAEIDLERKRAEKLAAALAEQNAKNEARDAEIDLERKRAEKLATELEELNAKKTERGMVLTLGDVLFESGKAQLLPGAYRTIDQLAAFLNEYTDRSVLIEGHTDNIGSQEYNLDLSQRRAEAVRDALLSRQIPFNRIVSKGYGKNYPVAGNDSEAGRQQNRRVDIIILDAGVKAESVMR